MTTIEFRNAVLTATQNKTFTEESYGEKIKRAKVVCGSFNGSLASPDDRECRNCFQPKRLHGVPPMSDDLERKIAAFFFSAPDAKVYIYGHNKGWCDIDEVAALLREHATGPLRECLTDCVIQLAAALNHGIDIGFSDEWRESALELKEWASRLLGDKT